MEGREAIRVAWIHQVRISVVRIKVMTIMSAMERHVTTCAYCCVGGVICMTSST